MALLETMDGMLSTVDADALAMYAEAWQDFDEAARIVRDEGAIITNPKQGTTNEHPAVKRKERAQDRIAKYFDAFGFSPKARKLLKIETRQDETDPFAEFLRRRQNMEGN